MSHYDTIGMLTGLHVGAKKDKLQVEQVYVRHLKPDEDDHPQAEHPVQLDGWVGWGTAALMNLTERQAAEVGAVLVDRFSEHLPESVRAHLASVLLKGLGR